MLLLIFVFPIHDLFYNIYCQQSLYLSVEWLLAWWPQKECCCNTLGYQLRYHFFWNHQDLFYYDWWPS